jgi:hypothetical protein
MGLIGDSSGGGGGGPTYPLDGVSGVTGAYSPSRDLLTSFIGNARETNSGGVYDTWVDQTGNNRTFSSSSTARPTMGTAGPNSIACGDFDGTNDRLDATSRSSFMSTTAGYMIVSFVADAIAQNNANFYENVPVIGDASGWMGIYLKNTAGSPETVQCSNFGGSANDAAVITLGTVYVVEWWIAGGNLFRCVNNGTPASVSTVAIGGDGAMGLGHAYSGVSVFLDGKVFEVGICSAVPAARSMIAADFMTHVGAL